MHLEILITIALIIVAFLLYSRKPKKQPSTYDIEYEKEKLRSIAERNGISKNLTSDDLKIIPKLLGHDATYLYCEYLKVDTCKGITYYSSNSFSFFFAILDRFYGRYVEDEGFFNFQIKRLPAVDPEHPGKYEYNKIEVTYSRQNEKYLKYSEKEDCLIEQASSSIRFDGGRIIKIELFEVSDVSVLWGDDKIVKHDSDLLFTLSGGRKFLLGTKWYNDSRLFFTDDSNAIKTHLKTRKKRLDWKR